MLPLLRRPLSLFLVAVACAALAFNANADEAPPEKITGLNPVQWRVVWQNDPAHEAILSWSTGEAGEVHRVHLRKEGSAEATIVDCQRSGMYTGTIDDQPLHFHHARLTELEPATRYNVQMESDGHKSPELHFYTAPADDAPVSLLFGGDSRSGWEERKQMNRLMVRLSEEQSKAERPPVLALAHGGDYIGDGRYLTEWSRWLSDHELTVGPAGRLLPIIAARGNHDSGPLFNEIFDFPPDDANYYAMDITPAVRLVTLNTQVSTAGDQQSWLDSELAAARPKHRWVACQYHIPAFPAVKVPGGALQSWVPLFEKYNVDLVCEADGHCIKRTAPIRDYKIDPTGVVYIGEGGLGVGQRTPKADRWYLNSPQAKTGSGHHIHLLTFSRDGLTIRTILMDGMLFDEATLQPRKLAVDSAAGE
ncbi:MAG: metallophosphoesterase family protein [Pirellulales bacterium]